MADDEANEAKEYARPGDAARDAACQREQERLHRERHDAQRAQAAVDEAKVQIRWRYTDEEAERLRDEVLHNRPGSIERHRHRDPFEHGARQVALIQAIGVAKDNIIKATTEEIVATAQTFYDFLTGMVTKGGPAADRPEPTEWR